MEKAQAVADFLPARLKNTILCLPRKTLSVTDEIRLRKNGVFSIFAAGKNIFPTENGVLKRIDKAITVSEKELEECVFLLCRGSVYSYEKTISEGYIPLPCGRAGVCGEMVEGSSGMRMRSISSVCIRIHRDIPEYGFKLTELYKKTGLRGTLIYSPPAMGKTTLLRSVVTLLGKGKSISPLKIGVADEREEIILPETDIGTSDVISGCKKSVAAQMLTRTMSPQVIVCDEITWEDTDTLIHATGTGVVFICSCHADTRESLLDKPYINKLIQNGVFEILVRVDRKNGVYTYDTEIL